MANKDLFKQAIAEAKSVREAAIANAKEALEESLTPHLKDMLAAKLQEMEDASVEEVVNESEVEETIEEAPAKEKDPMEAYDEENEGVDVEEAMKDDADPMEAAEDDSEESEDEAEGDEEAEEEEVEVKDMEVDDLKNLIRDIIAQEMSADGEEEMGDNDMDAGAEMEPAMDDMEASAEDEEIDLDELLAELESATNEEVEEEVTEEVEEAMKDDKKDEAHSEENSELTEALETIGTLQNQLQEVNLLNAKLMYVNKVFKANNLSEGQKVNIIAAFDKAETVKEVKLVFETVSDNVVTKKATKKVNESKLGMASKATGTTAAKPEVISEVSSAVQRMQKLAGII
jgi:hypothetical protein